VVQVINNNNASLVEIREGDVLAEHFLVLELTLAKEACALACRGECRRIGVVKGGVG
jgi:hypothetical protein